MADLFVVRRRVCRWERHTDVGVQLVAVLPDRAAAEEDARRRSREFARARLPRGSPFYVNWLTPQDVGGYPRQELDRITSLPAYAPRDWLLDGNIPDYPPVPMPAVGTEDLQEWDVWWEFVLDGGDVYDDTGAVVGHVPKYHLSDEQLARFWEAMDRFPFYDVAGVDWHPSGK